MLKVIEGILWSFATILILYSGIMYTVKLKFVQFHFLEMFKNIKSKHNKNEGISPFQSLMMVLGGRIGVGSIAGIALSIYLGGIGTIFWIWLIGFISAPNAFAETVLGVRYREKDESNIFKGGPSYYLNKGLGLTKIGALYAIIMIFSQIGGFLSIQANTITKSITNYLPISPALVGIIIAVLSFVIIKGGVKKISEVSAKLVPLMTLIYIITALYIFLSNISLVPQLFVSIIKSAFNIKAYGFGILGSMIIGIQRGIFSNEAGLGTGAIAASTVETQFPASQGYVQMIGIYITTFLVCTSTAIIILISDVSFLGGNINGIEITQQAFIYHLGVLGNVIVIVSIILFAFSTILSGYYDGESNLKYLFPKIKEKQTKILKIVCCIILFLGSIIAAELLWRVVNIFTAILAIINIYALLRLKKDVIFELRRYHKCGKMK